MVKLNRRKFIVLGTVGAGVAVISNWLSQESISSQPLSQSSLNLSSLYQSSNGLLELDLEAKESVVDLGGKQAYLLTYNGQVPAPRLEAKPGDKVRIHFTNNLAQPTNIHYHGLHIPITGNADNVFLNIEPREKLTYEFQIPTNHPSGTFWYHPHLHGMTAEQLFGGLAGLFIIRGEIDEIPEIKAAKEEFLVLQDFSLDEEGRLLSSMHMSLMMGREGELITVNGQINPSLSISANGLLRLRILNASTSRFYRLMIKNHSFDQIATDGNALNEPIEVNELLLTPGQRADVLVKGNQEPSQYRLLNLPYDRGSMGMMGGGMMGGRGMGMMGGNHLDAPITIATINYQSSVQSLPLPTKFTTISALPKPEIVRSFELNHGMNPMVGMAFLINGQPYNKNSMDTIVKLNTIEDWEITNTDVMDHPFHIHGNAFQVISRNGQPESLLAWRDTVLVPRGETVRIRTSFRDFVGKTVYHCHIFDHEDLGMMGNLVIEA
ncbi:cyclic nucleotide-binding protein [Stanieria cyanosphaera PCC 7437]|uniref:Cyclic nucleotide-binding protein n=1 Tax=Stanieria cyanosphaera (strain ATCC 29371 / PCC 7437) TaxID=111780 RepID=K9XSB8_STAC7|nr:multicopper oxidase family protein [Stanieria cyanosphaera]AFZ35433.1 cyclic nucleotide-binding protein [Stanieria cyanosphaera PCC 7437]